MNDGLAPVSAVIPCFRCADTIGRAVASIAAQTVRPAEVILVDDSSGDETVAELHRVAGQYPAGWVRVIALADNAGPGSARNAGWDSANQPWLAFLDADDAWHPRKIELQLAWMEGHSDAALCGHGTAVSPAEGRYPEVPAKVAGARVSFRHMAIANRFPTRSVILRRDLPFRFGGRNVTEDYLLWLEVVLKGHPAYRIEAPLAVSFREEFSPGGYSGQLWRHERRELAAWRILYNDGHLTWPMWALASIWSLVKFIRRTIMRR
jgi:glycosyltransferase involved in cell wall biosynthesis